MEYFLHILDANSLRQLVGALVSTLVLWGGIELLRRILRRRAHRTPNVWDDALDDILRGTRFYLHFAVTLIALLSFLTLPEEVALWLRRALLVALSVQIGLWGNRLGGVLLDALDKSRGSSESGRVLVQAFRVLGGVILWTLLTILVLDNLGFNVSSLLTGLGLGGAAVALAVKTILEDLFRSLVILVERPFEVGDLLFVGTGQIGMVERIGLRSTRLRSPEGEELIVPNGVLLAQTIRNQPADRPRQVVLPLSLPLSLPAAALPPLCGQFEDVVRSHPDATLERAYMTGITATGYTFEVVFSVQHLDLKRQMALKHAIQLGLAKAIAELQAAS